MKKIISVILVLSTIFWIASPVCAVQPRYTNVIDVSLLLNINSTGEATVTVKVKGTASLIETKITVYLERKVSSTWTRVNIGTTDNIWEYTTTSSVFVKDYSTQLGRTGTYRVVAIFDLTGQTIETITKTATDTY